MQPAAVSGRKSAVTLRPVLRAGVSLLCAKVVAVVLAALPATAETSDVDEDRAAHVEAVLAIEANPAYGDYLSSQCSTCHGEGRAGRIPPIRGMAAEDLIGALYEYRTGTRDNDVMRSIAEALGDDEMAALAAYYEGLNPQ